MTNQYNELAYGLTFPFTYIALKMGHGDYKVAYGGMEPRNTWG